MVTSALARQWRSVAAAAEVAWRKCDMCRHAAWLSGDDRQADAVSDQYEKRGSSHGVANGTRGAAERDENINDVMYLVAMSWWRMAAILLAAKLRLT